MFQNDLEMQVFCDIIPGQPKVQNSSFFQPSSENVPDYESRRRASLIIPSEKNAETEEIKKNDPGTEKTSWNTFLKILKSLINVFLSIRSLNMCV